MLSRSKFSSKQSGKRILIIDGAQSVGNLYETILRLDGYVVDTVNTIQDALPYTVAHQPDLIIATPSLFYLSGYKPSILSDLTTAVPHVPILAISAQKDSEFKYANSIAEHLHLPFKINQLRASVTRVLQTELTKKPHAAFNSVVHSRSKLLSSRAYQ